jgi:hypothetical protein
LHGGRCAERASPDFEESLLKPVIPNARPTGSRPASIDVPTISQSDAEGLLHKAHKVLVHYLPGTELPNELAKVRAMLDAHMFGRDKRTHRDDVVEVARLIDRISPNPVRLPQRRTT